MIGALPLFPFCGSLIDQEFAISGATWTSQPSILS